jgi:hypothetical protein
MKLKSVFFYQAVKIGGKMVNSANEADFDISFDQGLAFVHDKHQNITVAVPTTNIPQMTLTSYAPEKPLTNIEKARLAKAAKRDADDHS